MAGSAKESSEYFLLEDCEDDIEEKNSNKIDSDEDDNINEDERLPFSSQQWPQSYRCLSCTHPHLSSFLL